MIGFFIAYYFYYYLHINLSLLYDTQGRTIENEFPLNYYSEFLQGLFLSFFLKIVPAMLQGQTRGFDITKKYNVRAFP